MDWTEPVKGDPEKLTEIWDYARENEGWFWWQFMKACLFKFPLVCFNPIKWN
jgi:hypothetical protein